MSARKNHPISAFKILSYPHQHLGNIRHVLEAGDTGQTPCVVGRQVEDEVSVEARYADYIKSQQRVAASLETELLEAPIEEAQVEALAK